MKKILDEMTASEVRAECHDQAERACITMRCESNESVARLTEYLLKDPTKWLHQAVTPKERQDYLVDYFLEFEELIHPRLAGPMSLIAALEERSRQEKARNLDLDFMEENDFFNHMLRHLPKWYGKDATLADMIADDYFKES